MIDDELPPGDTPTVGRAREAVPVLPRVHRLGSRFAVVLPGDEHERASENRAILLLQECIRLVVACLDSLASKSLTPFPKPTNHGIASDRLAASAGEDRDSLLLVRSKQRRQCDPDSHGAVSEAGRGERIRRGDRG